MATCPSWQSARKVDREGVALMLPWLETRGWHITNIDGNHQLLLQKFWGDWLARREGGNFVTVELKTEQSHRHGNLFLEQWSNRRLLRPGWMYYCLADYLCYCFLDERVAYSVPLPALREWAFTDCRIEAYAPKAMTKREGDAWGWCVPVTVLSQEVPGFEGPFTIVED